MKPPPESDDATQARDERARRMAAFRQSGDAAEAAAPEPPEAPTARLHVLLADDEADACRQFEIALSLRGHQASVVYNGAEAVQAVEAATNAMFDVIVMDAHMPIMDGPSAIERIRALPAARLVPIVLLTAYDYTERETQRAGADLLLHKPILPDELVQRLEALV